MSLEYNNEITIEHLEETISITNVGVFIWNLQTNHVIYSDEWAKIVGYKRQELLKHVSTWESMLFPEDLKVAEHALERYLAGESPIYEAEFRMVKKDGSMIWGHDKGKVTKYTQDGKPQILCGVLQDITSLKATEEKLRENTNILNLAMEVASFGTWDWDLTKNKISYNDEYIKMLGYTQEEITGTLEEWESLNHPDDLPNVNFLLDEFIEGRSETYECETRMKKKNGEYVWTKDVGRIVQKDENGRATRVIGGHLNIDSLKKSQQQLQETLEELENYQAHLEIEIEQRTRALLEQDHLLLAVNDISRKLLTQNKDQDFNSLLTNCLGTLCNAYGAEEISLWRFIEVNGKQYLYIGHGYKNDEQKIFKTKDIAEFIEKIEDKDGMIYERDDGNVIICYEKLNRGFRRRMETEKVTTDFMSSAPGRFKAFLKEHFTANKSLLISPIYIYSELIGFIAVGSTMPDLFYTESQESMLVVSGKLLASAQNKHEMDEALREAHEEALLSSKAKSNFLANMSHEIRTPLNAILGMSEIILRESAGRATEEYAIEIKSASESLLSIINDILDISKIESGKIEISEVEYYVTSIFYDVISMTKIRLEDKPIIFTTFIDCNVPAKLKGDEIRVKQILLNLLGNATKFTKSGNINLSVTSERIDDKAFLKFEISDTGVGIKKEDMDRLFMQFERMDTKKNRNIEGTGLGLAITKQLCEMMGGTISVESEKDKGSVFTAVIPQGCIDCKPIAKNVNSYNILIYEAREYYSKSIEKSISNLGSECTLCVNQSEFVEALTGKEFDYIFVPTVHFPKVKNLKQTMNLDIDIVLMTEPSDLMLYREVITANLPLNCMQLSEIFDRNNLSQNKKTNMQHFTAPDAKVLVVDDNHVNLKVAKGLMSPFKFVIETAINGALAVEMVKNNHYDLVFMDHMMPEMDGIDATAEIRKQKGDYYKNLPIIALTANALVGAKELFVREGMNDFLAKPIESSKLYEMLKKWIPQDKQKSATVIAATGEQNDLHIEGVNTAYGIKLIGGNVDDYLDVVESFYYDGINKCDSIYDSFMAGDVKNFRIEVHAVKSAAASIGAFSVSDMAKNLENAAIKNDMKYIQANTHFFLDELKQLVNVLSKHVKHSDIDEKTLDDGDITALLACLETLENALVELDIDVIEEKIHDCMLYNWKGDITYFLNSIKELVEVFDYYKARPLVDKIKEEIKSQY